jgi:hypothetical protein
MMKLEALEAGGYLLPKLPNAKIIAAANDIVQQYNAARLDLRRPSVELMRNRLVGVETVDVEQIDAMLIEIGKRLLESASKEGGKRGVMLPVVGVDFLENLLSIKSRMPIALPSIHREAAARNVILQNRLAQTKIGFTEVGSKFNHSGRAEKCDQIVCKREVSGPIGDATRSISSGSESYRWSLTERRRI